MCRSVWTYANGFSRFPLHWKTGELSRGLHRWGRGRSKGQTRVIGKRDCPPQMKPLPFPRRKLPGQRRPRRNSERQWLRRNRSPLPSRWEASMSPENSRVSSAVSVVRPASRCHRCPRMMFRFPSPPAAPPASAEAAKQPGGEFTKMFLGVGAGGQKVASPAPSPEAEIKQEPAVKPSDKTARGQVPGGFEVVFQSRKQAPRAALPIEPPVPTSVPPSQNPAEPAKLGEFTQMFSSVSKGKADQAPPASVEPPPAAPPQSTMETAGHGEFTQMFSNMGRGKAGQPAAPPPPPYRPRRYFRRSPWSRKPVLGNLPKCSARRWRKLSRLRPPLQNLMSPGP